MTNPARAALTALMLVTSAGTSLAQTRPVPPPPQRRPPARPAPPRRPPNPIWKGIGFLSANLGYQLLSKDFSDSVTFRAYADDGEFTTDYVVDPAIGFDVGGAFRVWRELGVGGAVTSFRRGDAASVSGEIPHPFGFDPGPNPPPGAYLPREVTGTTEDLEREELGVHFYAIWILAVSRKVDLSFFGGPSIFKVRQELAESLRYTESFPYDTVALTGVNVDEQDHNAAGFNAGADVMYNFTRTVAVGGLVRYTRAIAEFTSPDTDVLDIEAGGVQVGVGIRVRF
jgi:opacity protein-like surface antigen